jgi:hypothetical protein
MLQVRSLRQDRMLDTAGSVTACMTSVCPACWYASHCSQAMLQVRSLRHLSGLLQLQELLVKPRGYIK